MVPSRARGLEAPQETASHPAEHDLQGAFHLLAFKCQLFKPSNIYTEVYMYQVISEALSVIAKHCK